jgi:hypothetical protein
LESECDLGMEIGQVALENKSLKYPLCKMIEYVASWTVIMNDSSGIIKSTIVILEITRKIVENAKYEVANSNKNSAKPQSTPTRLEGSYRRF